MNTETLTPEALSAHLFEAQLLADTAQEIQSGRHKLASGLASKHLSTSSRDLLAGEFWAASHGVHEWLSNSHGVPMACACPLYCALTE